MIFAERGNRVTQINESDIPHYVEQGYRIVDSMGTVLQDTVPNDLPNLKLAYKQHVEEIDKLKAKIKALESELEVAKQKTVKADKPKVESDATVKVVEEPKSEPKAQTRKRTKKAE